MKTEHTLFNEHDVIHELKHFLPAQAPLKDFIHHNTLHAFQQQKFHDGIRTAAAQFGYKVALTLAEYRAMYNEGKINKSVVDAIIQKFQGSQETGQWLDRMIRKEYDASNNPRIGLLRANWKKHYKTDLDTLVHPLLFRVLCSYLDQGISIWNFPAAKKSFISSLRELERNSFSSFFKTKRAKNLLLKKRVEVGELLQMLIGDEKLFKQYLFDQQFAHQGWSGMVSAVEDQPQTLLDQKHVTLHELILFECLLEIDALDYQLGEGWLPLNSKMTETPPDLFAEVKETELSTVMKLWQEAYEWSYYDDVLTHLQKQNNQAPAKTSASFQAMFCIDDRSCSMRRYIEHYDPYCKTYGTPGFFGVEFFFKPEHGKFYTKLCPAPVTPKFLIKEGGTKGKRQKELHFTKQTHSLFRGWIISQSLGFWSAIKLFLNIFRPTMSPASASSFRHMDKISHLTIENKHADHHENNLQIGFTIPEMTDRVEGLLKSIGLVTDFAPIVYVIGHGASSVNNPYYSAYDCGACSGRPGSVNARVVCFMANHPEVREQLKLRGIDIPKETQFIGGLHDTTVDDFAFYDEDSLNKKNKTLHEINESVFSKALDLNAKERSRRFVSVNTNKSPEFIHTQVRKRAVSLFEPRPEYNHATNAICVVGRRELTEHLFLDRRAFMNSFDYQVDPEGKYLFNILKAAAPVCGGINLEYFFSRVDNQKLGAGSKLPHNVMGLFGVANGIDGDLRPGLPAQMIEIHDPVRLLVIVEHFPEVVLQVIQKNAETYEWFINEWVNLIVIHPENKSLYYFRDGAFTDYNTIGNTTRKTENPLVLIESSEENLPVYTV